MLSVQELMSMHVDALYTHDGDLRLLYVNEPTGAIRPAPRFYLGRTVEGAVWRFRSDLPTDIVQLLETLCRNEPTIHDPREKPVHSAEYIRILAPHASIQRVWMGPAFCFPDDSMPRSTNLVAITHENAWLLRSKLAEWLPDVPHCRPFVAMVQGDAAVSLCCSVRITTRAHEAGVETLSAFRGRGYASEAVAGWAHEVREMGCIPLYSTSWENVASQSVARKLGLVTYGADFHVL